MSFIIYLIFFSFLNFYYVFFSKKILLLLILEGFMILMIMFFCLFHFSDGSNSFCFVFLSIFMVLESVFGISCLIRCSRESSVKSYSIWTI